MESLTGLVVIVVAFYAMYWIIRSGVSAGIQDAAAKQREQDAVQTAPPTDDEHRTTP